MRCHHKGQFSPTFTFIVPPGFSHPKTCAHVRLLGPCFKTGRTKPFHRQRPGRIVSRTVSSTGSRSDALRAVRHVRQPAEKSGGQPPCPKAGWHAPRLLDRARNVRSRDCNGLPRRASLPFPRNLLDRSQPTLTRTRRKCAARTLQTAPASPALAVTSQ